MRPAPSSFRLIAAAGLALALASCNEQTVLNDGGSTGGMDSGPVDAGPNCYCAALTEACSATQTCCGNLACTGGKCAQSAAPACVSIGNLCTTSAECCGSTDPGVPNYPNFTYCAPDGLGVSHCTAGVQGSSCSATKGCAYPLSCSNGACKLITTGNTCTGGNACQPGDLCDYTNDPCRGSGLVCPYPYGLCLAPEVIDPNSNLSEGNICNPGQSCFGRPGSSAATTCGTFWRLGQQPSSYPACMEACQTGADCSSIAWDCVTTSGVKQCQSHFCYAADIPQPDPLPPYSVANAMSAAQTMPVSNESKVLFKPCGAGAGPDTYCLPRYDIDWSTTVGVCTRVGGTGAGGLGAACQPNAAPSDSPGLCAAGNLCYRGTCHKWCDVNNLVRAGCDPGQACLPAGDPFAGSFSSTDTTGICANVCDPYLAASANTCPQSPTWTCDNPSMLCKPNLPAVADSDQFPQPGVCAGGTVAPIEVGMPCSTGIWVDPCVSGAFCTLPPGGGATKVCAQVCDVVPSPYMSEPACSTGFTCVSVDRSLCENLGRDGGWCKAFGTCQPN